MCTITPAHAGVAYIVSNLYNDTQSNPFEVNIPTIAVLFLHGPYVVFQKTS